MTSTFGYGYARPEDSASDFNAISFLVRQMIRRLSTMLPVQVVSVNAPGGLQPAGTVDVQPLVSMLDGNGNAIKYGTLFGLPYLRVQGGQNAVIIDPVVNDIGIAVFAQCDISAVINSKGQPSTPGSGRRYNMSDGIYLGGILNQQTVQQYIQFTTEGVNIADMNGNQVQLSSSGFSISDQAGNSITSGAQGITLAGTNVIINGNIELGGSITGSNGAEYSGDIKTTGDVKAGTASLKTHIHSGVTTGSGDSGPPV